MQFKQKCIVPKVIVEDFNWCTNPQKSRYPRMTKRPKGVKCVLHVVGEKNLGFYSTK
jgi:hypothetical protein